jgi:hypothetical protein
VNIPQNTPADPNATPAAPEQSAAERLAALPPGSPERAAAASELYNERNNPAGTPTPEGVPSKFVNAETGEVDVKALIASYTELEKKLGQGKPAEQPPAAGTPPAGEQPPAAKLEIPEGADPVSHVVTQAGLDPNALAAKVTKDGKLDDADYAAIEKLGIPRALIDQHVALVKNAVEAQASKNATEAVQMFGGADKMQAAIAWASQNKPAAEIERLNTKLAGPEWRDAVALISAEFAASSKEPTLARPGAAGAGSTVGYRSVAERTKDMQDPRYGKDPAFRELVRQRMAVSRYDLDR